MSETNSTTLPTLMVMSYNIHGAVGRDGKRDLARIATIIRNSGADLVALQEVDSRAGSHSASEQMQLLTEMTEMVAIPGPAILQHDRSYGNVLLTRLPWVDNGALDLSFKQREPRRAIDVSIETNSGTLRVIATHLGLGLRERRFQAKCLEQTISNDGSPTLLMGDLNEWLPFGGMLQALPPGMLKQQKVATYPSRQRLLALDRVCCQPADMLRSIWVDDSPEARDASDHLPVIAQIDLPAMIK